MFKGRFFYLVARLPHSCIMNLNMFEKETRIKNMSIKRVSLSVHTSECNDRP